MFLSPISKFQANIDIKKGSKNGLKRDTNLYNWYFLAINAFENKPG